MNARDELTPEQVAKLAVQLGDAKPARAGLLMSFGKSVQDRRDHDHTTQREDWYCLNLAAYMGERAAPVLRRLLDAESRAVRYRTAWKLAAGRARSLAGAADRAAERAREGQTALQDAVFTILGMQMQRDAVWAAALRAGAAAISAQPQEWECDPGRGDSVALLQAMADGGSAKGIDGGDQQPAFDGLLAHASGFEIPRPGRLPLLLQRSIAGGDRWMICDREGRHWHREHGFVCEHANLPEAERTDTRFPLAEAWPLALRIAAEEAGV